MFDVQNLKKRRWYWPQNNWWQNPWSDCWLQSWMYIYHGKCISYFL